MTELLRERLEVQLSALTVIFLPGLSLILLDLDSFSEDVYRISSSTSLLFIADSCASERAVCGSDEGLRCWSCHRPVAHVHLAIPSQAFLSHLANPPPSAFCVIDSIDGLPHEQ